MQSQEQGYGQYTSYVRPGKPWPGRYQLASRRRGLPRLLICAVAALLAALMVAAGGLRLPPVLAAVVNQNPGRYVQAVLPVWAKGDTGPAAKQNIVVSSLVSPVAAIWPRPAPMQMLQQQLPLLARLEAAPADGLGPGVLAPASAVLPEPHLASTPALAPAPLAEHNLVILYNTHTGETYALTDGMERLNGKQGGVVKVAAALEQELVEKHGVPVARSDKIHDAVYNNSYGQSQQTLRDLLAQNTKVQMVFDIHRDAGKSREDSVVTVAGQQVAPVLIIVGSDARTPFPDWQENHSFARELADEINRQHPGLCIGVRVQEGRYNQFLHPRALLLEMGSVSNSTEEAVASAKLLAAPIATVLQRYLEQNN